MPPDTVVLDQFVLTAYVPKNLPDGEADRARRALNRRQFRRRVLAAARRARDRDPALAPVTLTLTR